MNPIGLPPSTRVTRIIHNGTEVLTTAITPGHKPEPVRHFGIFAGKIVQTPAVHMVYFGEKTEGPFTAKCWLFASLVRVSGGYAQRFRIRVVFRADAPPNEDAPAASEQHAPYYDAQWIGDGEGISVGAGWLYGLTPVVLQSLPGIQVEQSGMNLVTLVLHSFCAEIWSDDVRKELQNSERKIWEVAHTLAAQNTQV